MCPEQLKCKQMPHDARRTHTPDEREICLLYSMLWLKSCLFVYLHTYMRQITYTVLAQKRTTQNLHCTGLYGFWTVFACGQCIKSNNRDA